MMGPGATKPASALAEVTGAAAAFAGSAAATEGVTGALLQASVKTIPHAIGAITKTLFIAGLSSQKIRDKDCESRAAPEKGMSSTRGAGALAPLSPPEPVPQFAPNPDSGTAEHHYPRRTPAG